MGRALRPIPQELFFLVGWAGEPVLIIFARRLLSEVRQAGSFVPPKVSYHVLTIDHNIPAGRVFEIVN